MILLSNRKHWIHQAGNKFRDKIFIRTWKQTISYVGFYKECIQTAEYLKLKGVKKNDNTGILFKHDYNFFVIANACWILGAVPVPINIRNTFPETESQIKQVDIKYLITDNPFTELFFSKTITFNKKLISKIKIPQKINSTAFTPNNNALILFTSGSSGTPKVVVHTFSSLYESVKALDSKFSLSQNDEWLASLPLYHIGGFMILIRALLSGSSMIFPNSLVHKNIVDSIYKFEPTHISIVPTTLKKLVDKKIAPVKRTKVVFLGGGPSQNHLCINAVKLGWKIVKVYGSTETCSMITALPAKSILSHPDSSGKALSDNKIKIMIKNKIKNIENSETGEIVVKSKSLFKEYFRDKKTTSQKFKDGYYLTGDHGKINKHGLLFVETRRDDIVISGGENISVKEISSAIISNPKVNDAHVFGIPDKKWGQKLCAAVVSKSKRNPDLAAFLKNNVAGYKIPKNFYFVKEIPRNEMGKVILSELKKKLTSN